MKTTAKTWLGCAVLGLAALAPVATLAETYYLKESDSTQGTSSFVGGTSAGKGGGWTADGGKTKVDYPSKGNDYIVENKSLRTPNISDAKTFAGDSLTIRTDVSKEPIAWGQLTCKHKGGKDKPMTIGKLILENGVVPASDTYSSSNKEKTLAGNVTINEGFYGFFGNSITGNETDDRRIYLESNLHGAGTFATVFQSANARVYLAGSAADFTGRVYIGRDDQYALKLTGAGQFFVLDGSTWFGDPAEFVADGFVIRNGSTIKVETDVVNTVNRGVQILDKAPTISVSANKSLAILAPMVSDFGFTKTGAGTITLAADNSGLTSDAQLAVSAGALKLAHPQAVGSAAVTLAGAATLEIDPSAGPVVFAAMPEGLANLKISAAEVTDPLLIPLFSYPTGGVIDFNALTLTTDLPDTVDPSVMTLQAIDDASTGLTTVTYLKPSQDHPVVSSSLKALTATTATFTLTIGYFDETVMDPLTVTAFWGDEDCGTDETSWDESLVYDAKEPGAWDYVVPLEALKSYFVAFKVQKGDGEGVWTVAQRVSTAAVAVTVDPAAVLECDAGGVVLTFSRPEENAASALTVMVSYSGATDAFDLTNNEEKIEFPVDVASVTRRLRVLDNSTIEGARTMTVALAESPDYVVDESSTAVITVLDDESQEPRECVWTGAAGDGRWATSGNWRDDAVPTVLDTAIFTSDGLTAKGAVTIGSTAKAARLVLDTPLAFTFSGGALQIGALERRPVAEGVTAGDITIASQLLLVGNAEGEFVCDLACGTVVQSGNTGKSLAWASTTDALTFKKIGAGDFKLSFDTITYRGPWDVKAGKITAAKYQSIGGTVTVGGGTERAELAVLVDNAVCRNDYAFTIQSNGVYRNTKQVANGRLQVVRASGSADVYLGNSYTYKLYMTGATISGGKCWAGGAGQTITAYESDAMSTFSCGFQVGSYNSMSVMVEDGVSPVDLLLSGNLTDGGSDKTLTKSGAGTLKTTANWSSLKDNCSISAGAWYVDNTGEYGMGIQTTTVAAGATLGGTGHIGMKDVKNYATLTLKDGTEEKYATLAPGTIDNETGAHVYGTFTVAYTNRQNDVSLGKFSHVVVGVSARDKATNASTNDLLKVHGTVTVGADCTLDLAANSPEDTSLVKGGTYTVLEAESIVGDFANVVVPKRSWKVRKVLEDGVVTALTVTIPDNGFTVMVR